MRERVNYRWVVMGALWSGTLFLTWVNFSLGVMLPRIGPELSLTPIRAGLLGSLTGVAAALLSMPLSLWLSRFSAKVVVGMAVLGGVLFTLLQGWSPSFEEMLVSRALFVVAIPALRPATALLIGQWFQPGEFAQVNSLTAGLTSMGQTLGIALTPWLMLALGGWRSTFYALGLLGLAITLFWLLLGRQNLTPEYRASLAAQEGTPLRALTRYRTLWLLAFCQIGSALAYNAFLTFWPTFATTVRGLPLTTTGLLMSLFPIGSVIGSFSAGAISNWLGLRKPVIWLPGLILPGAYLVSINSDAIPVIGLALFVVGFCALVVVPIIFTYPYELQDITPREVAVAWGLVTTVTTTGGALGPLVTGGLQQATGSLHTALTFAAVCALTLGVLPFFLPETGWRAPKGEAI